MIILLSEERGNRKELTVGDTFDLSHTLYVHMGDELIKTIRTKVMSSEIIMDTYVDYYCIFVYADDKGNVVGNNMCGFFGKQNNIPKEIKEAIRVSDLTLDEQINFANTCPIRSDVYAEFDE